jgi:hypothetical protein
MQLNAVKTVMYLQMDGIIVPNEVHHAELQAAEVLNAFGAFLQENNT